MNSYIDKIPKQKLKKIFSKSNSLHEILIKIGYKNNKFGYKKLKDFIHQNKIDISHFKQIKKRKTNINEYLVKGIKINSTTRRKIISIFFKNKCCSENCSVKNGLWNGKPITIQLDHINGNPFDNRLKNLRALCPNCHSQTDTFGSKNFKNTIREFKSRLTCSDCPKYLNYKNLSGKCNNCIFQSKFKKQKIEKLIKIMPISKICKKLKTTPETLKGFCIKNKINFPPKNFWIRTNKNRKLMKKYFKNKPIEKNRKYNYQKIYNHYKKSKNYQKTGFFFKIHRSMVRRIVKNHIKYTNI